MIMTDTTVKIPNSLAGFLDDASEHDPQWKNRSELARAILWEWVKDKYPNAIGEKVAE